MFHTCDTNASQYLVQGHRSILGLHDSCGLDVGDLFFSRVFVCFSFWQVEPAVMTSPCGDSIQIPEWEKAVNFQPLDNQRSQEEWVILGTGTPQLLANHTCGASNK